MMKLGVSKDVFFFFFTAVVFCLLLLGVFLSFFLSFFLSSRCNTVQDFFIFILFKDVHVE